MCFSMGSLRTLRCVVAVVSLAAAAILVSGSGASLSRAAGDFSVSESIADSTVSPGASTTINFSVSNSGPDLTQIYLVLDLGPGDWSLGGASQTSGPSFSCSTSQYHAECVIGTFPGGSSASFTTSLAVGAGATPGQILNSRDYVFQGMPSGGALASDGRSIQVGPPAPPPPPPPPPSPPPTASLSVTLGGTGTGTVTSTPAGIECGSTCTHAFDIGSSVTLSAVAASGSLFAGWDGACKAAGSASTCTVALAASQQVAATFDNAPAPPPGSGSGSKPLQPVTQRNGCTLRVSLPDRDCTPGAIVVGVTAADICTPGYSLGLAALPESAKKKGFASYGIGVHRHGRYEIDQLVPVELGGSNDQPNVWPELTSQFRKKNRLEDWLITRVCDGGMSLAQAQKQIARNWLAAYHAAGLKPF
jgi:hypothetical protein